MSIRRKPSAGVSPPVVAAVSGGLALTTGAAMWWNTTSSLKSAIVEYERDMLDPGAKLGRPPPQLNDYEGRDQYNYDFQNIVLEITDRFLRKLKQIAHMPVPPQEESGLPVMGRTADSGSASESSAYMLS